jgi:predicted RNA-binding protein with RPS1 domain
MIDENIEKLNRIEEKYKVGKIDLEDLVNGCYNIGLDAAKKVVKESDSLPCVSDQRKLFDFKDWWNELPDESDDKLFITKGTIERFLKSNSR